jgi:FtsP/CotA-like multicopper oxidase with cupredoxin domain
MILFIITILLAPVTFAEPVYYDISVGMMGTTTMDDGTTFPVWGFREGGGGMSPYGVPGPTIRAREGDDVTLHFRNTSMESHTIHLHGLDVSQINDGVPQTSFEIEPMGGTFDYQFTAPHAGTYAYHCHVHTVLHLQMGMYGTVVIDPADSTQAVWQGGPAYDIERIWACGEYDSYWHTDGGGPAEDFPYHEFNPDYFIVNGQSGGDIAQNPESAVEMDVDETLLVRVLNLGYLAHRLHFNGLSVIVVSSDGRPLPEQQTVSEFTVYPGERYDFIIDADIAGDYMVDVEYLAVFGETILGTATVPVLVTGVSSTDEDPTSPGSYALHQNFPNPFNPETTISFDLMDAGQVRLSVYNLLGQKVALALNSRMDAGRHSIQFDASDLTSGVYLYRIEANDFVATNKMMLMK